MTAQTLNAPKKSAKGLITNEVYLTFVDSLCASSTCTLKCVSISRFGYYYFEIYHKIFNMKIIIRHSEKKDIPAIKEIYGQHSCYSGTLQLPYPSFDKWGKFLSNMPENFHSLVAVVDDKILTQPLAHLGMEVYTRPRRKHVANIGMAVSENSQGKGFGTALLKAALDMAENWIAVRRIELEVYTDNEAAIELYKKHGFKIEGTAKNYAFRNGKYADVYLMARLL